MSIYELQRELRTEYQLREFKRRIMRTVIGIGLSGVFLRLIIQFLR